MKWTMAFAFTCLTILLGISGGARAFDQPFVPSEPADLPALKEVLASEREGNYQHAAAILTTLAQQNDADAEFMLGGLYQKGLGVPMDNAKTFFWYRKAADHPGTSAAITAESEIGVMYYLGIGVPKSYEDARLWDERAATAGDAIAQRNLGELYFQGLGGKRDYALAAAWFQRAASQGDAKAQALLGYLYKMGLGASQSYQTALPLLNHAASQNIGFAQANLGEMYERGEGVDVDYKQAAYWYEQAIAHGGFLLGLAQTQVNLGLLYLQGRGVAQDCKHATTLFDAAAKQQEASAMTYEGSMYLFGQCRDKDFNAARMWELRALKGGDIKASYYLGLMAVNGAGIQKNRVLGYALIDTATSSGHASPSEIRDGDKIGASLNPEELEQARAWSQRMSRGGTAEILKAMDTPQAAHTD